MRLGERGDGLILSLFRFYVLVLDVLILDVLLAKGHAGPESASGFSACFLLFFVYCKLVCL